MISPKKVPKGRTLLENGNTNSFAEKNVLISEVLRGNARGTSEIKQGEKVDINGRGEYI